MGALFYPYISVTLPDGAKRSLGQIAGLLPRVQSDFLADTSTLWAPFLKICTVFQCGRSIRCSSALYR